nr:MAG TPA: hypothetical protein [Caudoviricetes sp.]
MVILTIDLLERKFYNLSIRELSSTFRVIFVEKNMLNTFLIIIC